jgi:superfamily I DNA and/or RNA helicase
MPPAIGNFISKNIYAGHLLSNPEHPVLSNTCCRFVEVAGGEEKKVGYSWEVSRAESLIVIRCLISSFQNVREAELVVHLVRQLVHQGRTKNFRVITPYEAQQNRIEVALKVAGLPWEDKCFALDSFQGVCHEKKLYARIGIELVCSLGNEADYIIISVVRTVRPGFLQNKRRTNVMLTRCKKGMAILSQKQFLTSDLGRDTLVGQLAAEWSAPWITAKEVLNNRRVFD